MKRLWTIAALGAATILMTAGAFAQGEPAGFPGKPVRLITLTTPGGSLDILARVIAQNLSGLQVFVENKTGAGGNIGAEQVARSAPDGYTIGMITSSTHGINPSLYGAQ